MRNLYRILYLIGLFSLLFGINPLYAANYSNQKDHHTIDSLKIEYNKTSELTRKLNVLREMHFTFENPELVKTYIQKISLTVIKANNPEIEFQYYDLKGDILSNENREKGFKLHVKCLAYYEKTKNRQKASSVAYKIARYYFYSGDLPKALKFAKLADQYCVEKDQALQAATIKMVIGVIYSNLSQDDSALIYQQQALDIKYKYKFYSGIPVSLSNISEVYIDMGDTAKAMETIDKSIHISDSLNLMPELNYANFVKGSFLNRQGKYKSALPYLLKSAAFWESHKSYTDLQGCYEHITMAYENLKDYQNAFNYHRKLSIVSDTLFNIAKLKSVSDLEAKYQTEKKELEILKQKADLTLIEGQKRNQLTIFILIALFLVFNAVVLYKRYQKQKKDKELISSQKIQLEVRNKDIEDSISYSSRVQQSIFPSLERFNKCFNESFILFLPKEKVSGDFYWLEKKGDLVLVAAADCTGHGVPGAMVSVVCHNALNRAVNEYHLTDPGLILDNTREQVIDTFSRGNAVSKDGMDISLGGFDYSNFHKGKVTLHWAGANNPVWILQGKNDGYRLTEIKPNKQPIGTQTNAVSFVSHKIELAKGDIVYLFTDGYADQFGGEKGKKFKYAQLQEMVITMANESMKTQSDKLYKRFEEWRGDLEQIDDVCIIGIKI